MTEHTITDEMVTAFVRANDATWTECAPTTQGEAVSTHRKAVRAGLSAALALVQPASPCGHRAPNLALLANTMPAFCELPAGHTGWHKGDDGSKWVEGEPPAESCPCTCHQPDRCPCKPGAPEHKHGAGGYCTVADVDQAQG